MAADYDTPKGVAVSILGPTRGSGMEESEESTPDEEDAESVAIGLAADEILDAVERRDREGMISALRSVLALRDGG